MKKLQKEIITKKDYWMSVDGKEFESEADCSAWEKSYKGTLEASFKNIKKLSVDPTNYGVPYSSSDDEAYVLKVNSLDEVALLNAYTESATGNNTSKVTADKIGKELLINFGYCRDFCDVYELDWLLNNIVKNVTEIKLKYKEMEEKANV